MNYSDMHAEAEALELEELGYDDTHGYLKPELK